MIHQQWAARGFGDCLVPVIPPNAPLANPHNKDLARERGKAVGLMGKSGRWFGWPQWRTEHAPDPAEMDSWGANAGLRCDHLRAVDIDSPDPDIAAELEALALRVLGPAKVRIGSWPKRLLLYAAADDTGKMRLPFRRPGVAYEGSRADAIEILARGQQFVAAGTHPSGVSYSWPNGEPERAALTPATAEALAGFLEEAGALLEARGCEVGRREVAPAGEREVVDQASLAAPSPEVLAAALAALPNTGDRETWIACGHAIKAAGGTVEMWRQWSDKWAGPPEDTEDLERRWAGMRGPFLAGWPWIELRARGAGWLGSAMGDFAGVDAPMLAAKAELLGDPVTESEAGTLQEQAFRDWVWVEAVERFGCLADGALLTTKQFSVRLNWWGPPLSVGKSAAAQFLADPRCRKVVGITYKPGAGREVEEDGLGLCFNRWRPSGLVPLRGGGDATVRAWLDHMAMIVPDAAVRARVLDWMAGVLQRQDVKINYALVLGGLPGIGKDMAFAPLVRALGTHNVSVIGMADLEAAQNDWCAAARLVVVNEAHSTTRVAAAERLKPHIAAPPWVIRINTKNVPQYQIPNRHVMLFFTNRRDAISIEHGDRRYFVVWSDAEKQPEAYYRGLWAWMEAGGFEHVAGWLLDRDLSAWNPHGEAPWTREKDEMARDTRSDLAAEVADAIEAGDWPDLVNPGDLATRLNALSGHRGRAFTGKAVAILLRQHGARPVHEGVMIRLRAPCATGADRVRLMSLRNHDQYAGMLPVALARCFEKGWAEKDGKEFRDAAPALSVVTVGDLL